MQNLGIDLKPLLKNKIENMESDFKEFVKAEGTGHMFLCPFCNYTGKYSPKGSAKIFEDNSGLVFKCFSCSKWRRI